MFMEWLDLDPKRPLAAKIEAACAAYARRSGRPATLALINVDTEAPAACVPVEGRVWVRRGVVLAGEP